MTMLLRSAKPGVYTVRRVTGKRAAVGKLENIGIASGADVKVVEALDDGVKVEMTCGKQYTISNEQAGCVQLTEQFKRGDYDPVFFSCCMYGNTVEFMERADKINAESRQKCLNKE